MWLLFPDFSINSELRVKSPGFLGHSSAIAWLYNKGSCTRHHPIPCVLSSRTSSDLIGRHPWTGWSCVCWEICSTQRRVMTLGWIPTLEINSYCQGPLPTSRQQTLLPSALTGEDSWCAHQNLCACVRGRRDYWSPPSRQPCELKMTSHFHFIDPETKAQKVWNLPTTLN